MRKLLILLMFVSVAFAGKGKQIQQLSAENAALNTRVQELTSAVQVLERDTANLKAQNLELQNKNQKLEQTIKEKELLIKQYTDQLKKYRTTTTGNTTTTTVVEHRQVPTLMYPVSGKLMDKKDYDASNQACRIIFYNGSAQDLLGFTANLRFTVGGQVVNDCIVQVNERVSTGENVSWYGAIPYNMTDSKGNAFYNARAESMDVIVEVHSITTTSGVVKNFLK